MYMPIYCRQCGEQLIISNMGYVRDVNNKPVSICNNCSELVLEKLKADRLVEIYKGNAIYKKDNVYFPYWGCAYFYNTIEGVRDRIDHHDISIVPTDLLRKAIMGEDLL